MKYEPDSVMFEITRFCNMDCPICVRGEPQRVRIKKETVINFLRNFENSYLMEITVTGGEPALAVDLIDFIRETCETLNIEVGSFYMVTNGTVTSKKFFDSLLNWWEFCSNNDLSGLRVSVDSYHTLVDLDKFKEFEEYVRDNYNIEFAYYGAPEREEDLVHDGRAILNYDSRKPVEHDLSLWGKRLDGTLYCNAKGDIITTCDISYESQESPSDFNIGNINSESLESLLDRFFQQNPDRVYNK